MTGPSPSAHQVLVYSGPGVSALSLSHTLLTLSLLLLPHYTVQPVTSDVLSLQPWEPSCALLVIPGGRDLPFVEVLSVKTKITKRVKDYVEQGGKYLGICAGAYFGSAEVRFDQGGGLEVTGERDLAFFPGPCVGPTFTGFAYAAESGSRAVTLLLDGRGASSSKPQALDLLYYNGGGHFLPPSPGPSSVRVLARYAESASSGEERPIAAVITQNGKGKALLCSVHFEYYLNDPPARDAISRLTPSPSVDDVERCDKARIQWVEDLLEELELRPTSRQQDRGDILGAIVHADGEEDPNLLLHPTHPSPIFVLSHPNLPQPGELSFSQTALQSKVIDQGSWKTLRDGNDELHITSTSSVLHTGSMSTYLATWRRAPPPVSKEIKLEDLTLEDSATSIPQPPDFNKIPKTILLPSHSLPYSPTWTPLFNFTTYWTALDAVRKRAGRKSGLLRNGKPTLGDLLWYAETVTSTQTMLDRNPLLLTHLPTPLAFLASFQLTGRGRGSNIWLSPPGCLQFSILLDVPSSMSSKLVFIQYLTALAVCEAVDEDGRLGVRIKWPNDIYAEVEGVGGSEVGSGVKGKAKLGGILVNTNFVGGMWRVVVVGCGINTLNALPTTSLSQLHSLLCAKLPERSLPPPTMEEIFAKIMHSFALKWEQFVDEQGFKGFLDEYYGRWLHTNQEVTLTTVTPHQRLRIHSITPDHGLLRCLPLSSTSTSTLTPLYDRGDFGDSKRSQAWVDLQPDGNSFDLMSGLIKRKT
ncbi:biotin-[acetyl-CoA-carboxylase] ligase [Tremella mesenterica]|uniref:Biotin-[acetyl-CoA-carboxylase] ligase n=1 Tax=Tremella mesenterica TaxID=5217 RepID=A0A4Q1BR47_TREME|nr:uncharacterized protein TREMEDRAFT_40864 [Tremella mesenterica DSM 1558]EIW66559.1 hypothetical protein TREMEDRAFT_40864 [Tremella mesenterica DSM 1558]RXK40423.1 biotin-[acetyl-CoA-carboxylase] ligase [Tremella mesenterica]